MAYVSFPNTPHNSRAVTLAEHEELMFPVGSEGLIGYTGTAAVFADSTGLQVKIPLGVTGWIRGTVFDNTSETVVPVGSNASGSTRIDLLVLRLDRSNYTITPVVIAGIAGAAAPSAVRDENWDAVGTWDLPLAEITVINGASTITAAQVALRGWYLGPDGQYICTSTSRPPHVIGRRIRETDTSRTLESTGSSWLILLEDTGWIAIPANTGWTASGFCRARRYNGNTTLLLHFTRTGAALAAGTASVMGGLTADLGGLAGGAFRPDTGQALFFTGINSAGMSIRCYIDTVGAIQLDAYPSTYGTGSVFTHSAPIVYPSKAV